MTKTKHPEWILKHKKKGVEIRKIKGRYYLYKISSHWDKEKKRAVKDTLGYLGRITKEHGFIPKGKRTPKPKTPIIAKEYGATQVLTNIGQDIVEGLQKDFPKDWNAIYSLALMKLLYRDEAPLKNMTFLFESSYLSEHYPKLNLSKNKLTKLLRSVGKQDKAFVTFVKRFVKGSKHTLFDVSSFISNSTKMDLNLPGYNSKGNFEPQVNYLYSFAVDLQTPGYFRILPGDISGMQALKLTIKESGLKNAVAIGDKGFSSNENIKSLEQAKLKYVFPLRRNSSLADFSRLKHRDHKQAFDGHFFYNDRPIFHYKYTVGKRKYFMFYDKKLEERESKSYLKRIQKKCSGYNMKGFHKKQFGFGTILLVTNLGRPSAKKVFELYKTRAQIEVVFDALKNTLGADTSYMQSDESFKAWALINHIALLLYYRILNKLKNAGLSKKYSPKDVLQRLKRVKKIKIKGSWYTTEMNSKTKDILEELNIAIP